MIMEQAESTQIQIPIRRGPGGAGAAGGVLSGTLTVPDHAVGLALFAHGSGNRRLGPRPQHAARTFNHALLATLVFDLLTEQEGQDRSNIFDISLLAHRLQAATAWAREQPETSALPIGYFGAGTGAAAALVAAAQDPMIGAVVSRAGRIDLARYFLSRVRAPVLAVVGSRDSESMHQTVQALPLLRGPHELVVIRGAGHRFDEPGAWEQLVHISRQWLARYLGQPSAAAVRTTRERSTRPAASRTQ